MAVLPPSHVPVPPSAASTRCDTVSVDQLRRVPLFGNLTAPSADKLCSLLVLQEATAGAVLFKAGDPGAAMYFIDQGSVRIHLTDADGQDVTLAQLSSGDFFGEMAMVDGQARSANATAAEDSRLAILTRQDFIALVGSDQQIMLGMLAAMARRLRHTDNLLRHRVARNANAEEAERSTRADRAADAIATFGGSWKFILGSLVFLTSWMLWNWIMNPNGFDPYPYAFLLFILNILQAFQAPIIMMSQNRQSNKDHVRADLDYAVNLKNELMLTEIRNLLLDEQKKSLGERPSDAVSNGRTNKTRL
ncbi:MAG: DUF1003 domain-containing protein [Verrucomicrobiota bacterium]|nr:DUF1003 domain-containing protein [Verrucomicrobiota bacterium]